MEEQPYTPTPIPDWSWHYTAHCPELLELDRLRTYHPILWALIIGHRRSAAIARALGMPHEAILYELRRYKKDALVHDEQAPSSIVWKLDDEDMLELKAYVTSIRRAEKTPDPREEQLEEAEAEARREATEATED